MKKVKDRAMHSEMHSKNLNRLRSGTMRRRVLIAFLLGLFAVCAFQIGQIFRPIIGYCLVSNATTGKELAQVLGSEYLANTIRTDEIPLGWSTYSWYFFGGTIDVHYAYGKVCAKEISCRYLSIRIRKDYPENYSPEVKQYIEELSQLESYLRFSSYGR